MTRKHKPDLLSPEKMDELSRDKFVRPLPKRFYKQVSVAGEGPEFGIALDGRAVKTPLKATLAIPGRELANAIAAEWEAQTEFINAALMPLTKLVNTTIDRVSPERARIIAEITSFADADLICYRAESPAALMELQSRHWDPVLEWAAETLKTPFLTTTAILHKAQPPQAMAALAAKLDTFTSHQLCAIHNLSTLTGSALLGAAMGAGAITPEAAWTAAHVDEDWQISHWGEDHEAVARRAGRQREFHATANYLRMVS
ncbi:MAG: ATPase [Aestuariivirgaceae bacterium]|nr:ATPase [Aestuariivirgaceae bacterium]